MKKGVSPCEKRGQPLKAEISNHSLSLSFRCPTALENNARAAWAADSGRTPNFRRDKLYGNDARACIAPVFGENPIGNWPVTEHVMRRKGF